MAILDILKRIEVLEAVFQFANDPTVYIIPEENPAIPIGHCPLDLLFMINLLCNKKTNLPEDYKDMVGIIKLADYWGGDEILRIISDQLQLPRQKGHIS